MEMKRLHPSVSLILAPMAAMQRASGHQEASTGGLAITLAFPPTLPTPPLDGSKRSSNTNSNTSEEALIPTTPAAGGVEARTSSSAYRKATPCS